jgi:hypothetical protein
MAWPITADLRQSLKELFPVRRDRRVVFGLVALAAVVSTTELAATQLFSILVLPQSDRSTTTTVLLVVLFFAVFGGLRLVNYAREMYRINVFERALVESQRGRQASDSWRWAMAMEVTSLLSAASRAGVVVAACLVLAPVFGVAVLVVVAAVGKVLSVIFVRQLHTQRGFRAAQVARSPVSNATKLRSRVRAGEIGSLIGYSGIVLLIGLLILLTLDSAVTPGTAFVVFVALRMLGQILSEIAKMLMRYVRARAFSE